MQRDLDLLRKILLEIEKKDDGSGRPVKIDVADVEPSTLYGHLILLDEAGLIEGDNIRARPASHYRPFRLTWDGHEFLGAVRDEGIWSKTIRKISEISGATTLEVVKALAVRFSEQQLGLS